MGALSLSSYKYLIQKVSNINVGDKNTLFHNTSGGGTLDKMGVKWVCGSLYIVMCTSIRVSAFVSSAAHAAQQYDRAVGA